MIHQFLNHMIDIKRSDLIDKLVAKNILSVAEKQRINEQKRTDARVDSLMTALSEKSGDEFGTFLMTLSETGQQSVARVAREALHEVGQTGHNPLQYTCGMSCTVSLLSLHINNFLYILIAAASDVLA